MKGDPGGPTGPGQLKAAGTLRLLEACLEPPQGAAHLDAAVDRGAAPWLQPALCPLPRAAERSPVLGSRVVEGDEERNCGRGGPSTALVPAPGREAAG